MNDYDFETLENLIAAVEDGRINTIQCLATFKRHLNNEHDMDYEILNEELEF